MTPSAERVEKLKLSYAADSSINWHNPLEKCLEISTKVTLLYKLKPAILFLDIYLTKCTHVCQKNVQQCVVLLLMIPPNLN